MSPYTPRIGGITHRVIEFFQANPEEELTIDDIAQKFDATRNNVHSLLVQAIDNELISRTRNEDGDYVYHLQGHLPGKTAKPAAAAPKPVAEKRAKVVAARKSLDISKLKVEEGIPFQEAHIKGESKWAPLFAKLTKPGQSIAVPADMRGAVGAAANKVNGLKTQGRFRVALVDENTARVWRVA